MTEKRCINIKIHKDGWGLEEGGGDFPWSYITGHQYMDFDKSTAALNTNVGIRTHQKQLVVSKTISYH